MVKKQIKIHIDGMDLAGKTSTIEIIKRRLGSQTKVNHISYLGNRKSNPILTRAEQMHATSDSQDDIVKEFYQALIYDIENYVDSNKNLIQDSSIIMRTIAHQGANSLTQDLFSNIVSKLPKMDVLVILTANEKSRIERLLDRKQSFPEDVTVDDSLIKTDPEKFFLKESRLVNFAKRHFDPLVIDTSEKSVKEVSNIIFSAL